MPFINCLMKVQLFFLYKIVSAFSSPNQYFCHTSTSHIFIVFISTYSITIIALRLTQAYHSMCPLVLSSLVPVLPPFDNQPLEEDVEGRCPPLTIISMIDHCSSQLLSLVGGARIGVDKQLDLQVESEELLCVRGYFLTWRILLKYLEYANRQVRQ